jgi:hypothetical protein
MPLDRTDWRWRLGGAAAAALLLFIFVGCMSLTIGGRTEVVHHEENVLTQDGEAKVAGDCEMDVYYPVPYPHVPNLTLSSCKPLNAPVLLVQKEDHFRVKNPDLFPVTVQWTAKGERQAPPVLVAPVSPPLPAPLPEVPPKPAPVVNAPE